jgi:hypothetical protein
MAVSGPLADHVFEPRGGVSGVTRFFGPLLGYGPGSGMAVMLLLAGVCGIAAAAVGLTRRTLRDIDGLLPDLITGAAPDSGTAPASETGPATGLGTGLETGPEPAADTAQKTVGTAAE